VGVDGARASWSDDRLDDLSRRVDAGFDRVDRDLRALSARVDTTNVRIDALQRSIIQVGGGMIAALAAGFLGLIATLIATQF
jgi:hypothetical protein